MIITLSWLKDHLSTSANLSKIVDKLTNIGLEVESINQAQEELSDFKIAIINYFLVDLSLENFKQIIFF